MVVRGTALHICDWKRMVRHLVTALIAPPHVFAAHVNSLLVPTACSVQGVIRKHAQEYQVQGPPPPPQGGLQPGVMQPGVVQPGVMQPGIMQPGVMQPGVPPGLPPGMVPVPMMPPQPPQTGKRGREDDGTFGGSKMLRMETGNGTVMQVRGFRTACARVF